MIDLHCHILKKLDDGPQTDSSSLRMVQAYFENGYRIVVATPHMIPGTAWMPSAAQIRQKVCALNRAINRLSIKVRITYGMEIALDPKIPSLLDEGRLLGLGGATFLLIEPSFQGLQDGWQHIIFSIQARGYSVLLAHPERCEHLAETPRMIEQLVECGVHIQVNYGSFLGRYGRAVADSARFLAEKGQIHCIATDSHSYTDLDASGLQTVKDKLLDLIGPDNFQLVSHENPLRVLKGEPLKAMRKNDTGVRSGKARIWSFFRTSDQKHRVQTRTS